MASEGRESAASANRVLTCFEPSTALQNRDYRCVFLLHIPTKPKDSAAKKRAEKEIRREYLNLMLKQWVEDKDTDNAGRDGILSLCLQRATVHCDERGNQAQIHQQWRPAKVLVKPK